ncbi:MAG: 2,4-dienoyl-CoA reductase, partial [Candidatus Ventricola sp.]
GKKNTLLCIEPEKSQMLAMGARVIEDGCMDMIGLGRQSFADPFTPLKLAEGREDEIKYCTQCMNCEELMIRQQPVGCVAYNKYYTQKFVETRKQFGKLTELHT